MTNENTPIFKGDAISIKHGKLVITEPGIYTDGISLISSSHPKANLWRRIKLFFKWPKLDPNSLEIIEIEINDKEKK